MANQVSCSQTSQSNVKFDRGKFQEQNNFQQQWKKCIWWSDIPKQKIIVNKTKKHPDAVSKEHITPEHYECKNL